MKPDTRYYCSQIVAIPAVGLPSVLCAIFLGGFIARLTGDRGPVGLGVICLAVGYATFRLTSLVTGWLLEKAGMLPRGAWRVYPNAGSWGGYLKKTGLMRLFTWAVSIAFASIAVNAAEQSSSNNAAAIAVTDFESSGTTDATKDWAYGLADVLAVELQQRGVTLFERQQIRVLLGERRITASGLMQLRSCATE